MLTADDRTLLGGWTLIIAGVLGSLLLTWAATASEPPASTSPEWPRSRPVALADGYGDCIRDSGCATEWNELPRRSPGYADCDPTTDPGCNP